MNYWLMKSEPDVFGIEDLARRKIEPWDGVRNYEARNFMRAMRKGDRAFLYHSNCPRPAIVGIMRIARESYPDPTAFDPESAYFDTKSTPENPRWSAVDVGFVRRLKRPVSLAELKHNGALADLRLLQRGSRLSVMPVTSRQWEYIIKLENLPDA